MKSSQSSLLRRIAIGGGALVAAAGIAAAVGAAQPTAAAAARGLTIHVDGSAVPQNLHEESSYAPVVKRVSPSVVKITVRIRSRNVAMNGFPGFDNPLFRQFFGNQAPQFQQQTPEESALGSGVIVSPDGYIVTNNHVVADAKEVKVTLADGREYPAHVVGRDPQTDVAVIKIDAHHLPAITFANSDKVEVGDRVLAIGNPFGIGETVTTGIVSAKERKAGLGLAYEDFIQTDAAINPGNSGGALVDVEGRLVGINTAILSRSGGFQGVGLAVPSDLVTYVADSLVAHGKVVRGYLGINIQDLTPELAQSFNMTTEKGALISEVQPDSPASRAGLKSGDVITAVDGQPVDNASRLSLSVGETAPGTKMTLSVIRDGHAQSFTVTTERKPGEHDGAGDENAASSDDQGVLNGVGVSDIDSNARQQLDLPDNLRGALVTSVDPNSASARAGIQQGDVILEINRHPVTDAKTAVDLTEKAESKRTLVKLWSKGSTVYVVVDETDSGNNNGGSGSDNDGSGSGQ